MMYPYCAGQEKAVLSNAQRKREAKASGQHLSHTQPSLRRARAAKLSLFLDRLNAYAEFNMPSLWDVR